MATIEGNFTINQINQIKSEIQKHLSADSLSDLVISNFNDIDITFFQLLLSLNSVSGEIFFEIAAADKKKISGLLKSFGYHKDINLLSMEN